MTVFNSTYTLPPQLERLAGLRSQFDNLQLQLATDKKTTTYGGLGGKSGLDLTLKQHRSEIGVYKNTIDVVDLRLRTLDQTSTRLEDIRIDSKAAIDPNNFQEFPNGRAESQTSTEILLRDFIAQLNTNVGGRYLFSGNATDEIPVTELDRLLEGDADEAGLKQVVKEFEQANLGTDGKGRLASARTVDTAPDPDVASVSLAEDTPANAAHPFGFKLKAIQSDLSNVSVTDNIASPASGDPRSISLQFDGQPEPGEVIRLFVDLPDGTEREIRIGAEGPTQDDPEFTFAIGADALETSQNFQATLDAALAKIGRTDLKAASAVQAAENFFDTAPRSDGTFGPQRVQPGVSGTFADATAIASDPNNTINWYQGENGTGAARQTSTGTVDENLRVSYGARANEKAYREVLQSLATFVAADFSSATPDNQEFYQALADRTKAGLTEGENGISGIRQNHIEFAAAHRVTADAKERHKIADATIDSAVADIENINREEVALKLLRLQTVLQASYQTTKIASDLSLSNFL